MRVVVDRTLCRGHGQCSFVAPDVFDIDDEGVMHCDERPPDSRSAAVEEAVRFCPELALSIAED